MFLFPRLQLPKSCLSIGCWRSLVHISHCPEQHAKNSYLFCKQLIHQARIQRFLKNVVTCRQTCAANIWETCSGFLSRLPISVSTPFTDFLRTVLWVVDRQEVWIGGVSRMMVLENAQLNNFFRKYKQSSLHIVYNFSPLRQHELSMYFMNSFVVREFLFTP